MDNQQTAEKLTDEQLKTLLDNLTEEAKVPPVVEAMMRADFEEYVKRDNEIQQNLDELQDQYKRILDDSDKEFQELLAGMDLPKVVEKLTELTSAASKIGNVRAVEHYKAMIRELRSSVNLDILSESARKIKNPGHAVAQASGAAFDEEFGKFRSNLAKSKDFYFADPGDLAKALDGKVDPVEARVFLYGLARSTNTRGQKAVDRNALFLGQLVKNVYALDDESFTQRDELVASIKRYAAELTSRA